jgi:lipopolysaccharide/colanic/teichoic acid biosynthesis glycosyltransferase
MANIIKKTSSGIFYLFLLVGIFVVVFVPPVLPLGLHYWGITFWKDTTANSMLGSAAAFFLASMVLRRFEHFPQKNSLAFLLPISLSTFGVLLTTLLVFRLSYSIQIIGLALGLSLLLLGFQHLIISRTRHLKLFLVPLGEALSFEDTGHYVFKKLKKPDTRLDEMHGVVADMHSDVLTPEWERFLSKCALQRIPVYNAMQLKETLTGKVDVKHLIANNFGDLSPSFFYQNFKRVIDITFLIIVSPVIVPIMVILAIWISLDSPGGPIFIQQRMGLGGKWFNVVKFRSMYINHEGSHFTEQDEDHRITRAGKILRKYRLDELPQFWNVLKGEMSLIGPRPESAELAKWYDGEVPFFAYRHVVRPGISGWAQVMHGYAAGVDEMKDKLAYDFYYIKHFSLWLDLLIWYKTIRTVLTGFGSR